MSPIAAAVAQGVGVVAGALLVKNLLDAEAKKPMAGGFPRCPRCNGAGRTECLCTRWSDKDYGCRSCGGSGRMRCNSCGGSGTGRPIPAQVRAGRGQ
ncbi:uncharacterized protein LOC112349518 [Selaginella moellendorffii]|uniref:uncharacterized protein LOC112349518 n=1 Tax=Selaginella moellendorffii TaxID=88036 RepID=UPI000D1C4CAE|nr:uncharacterized protein LOC112349518 [Selaginella moellendorffii]|eukprot:XP_024539870.1 uncharacterized protein LOC112349518 [Selaginella moellendorffii]